MRKLYTYRHIMMKKIIPLLVVLSIVFILYIVFYAKKGNIPQPNQRTIKTLLTQDLDENSSGQQVAILQSALRSDSSLYTGEISGFFTLTTIDAVKRFQKKYLLSPTGKVDLITRLKFNEIFGEGRSTRDYINSKNGEIKKWGMATKVEGTRYGWSMKIENDFHMGTVQELFGAINAYRLKKDKSKLEWSESLALFAQKRADELNKNGGVDEHRGFKDYIRYSGNRIDLGFMRLGENTSCGYRMTAIHMIEWIFAGDIPHDENQLNSRWTHVGIGVNNTCVSLVFGNNKQ